MAEVTPMPAGTLAPWGDGEYHNWTELLHLLNLTFTYCEVPLDENVKRVVLFVLYLLIFAVGLAENLLVIWVNWEHRAGRNLINLYVLNMAVADLGVLLSLPVWMLEVTLDYRWLWGSFLCQFTHYFYFTNMYASIFLLTALSVDRYVSLTGASAFWCQHQHRGRRLLCAGLWLVAGLIPFLEVTHMKLVNGGDPVCVFLAPFESYDQWALAASLVATVVGFLVPFPIIAICNILTARHMRRCKPESRRHQLVVYAYVGAFLLSWLPFHVMLTLLTLESSHIFLHCHVAQVLYFFYEIIDCFTLLHCVVNPLLYNFLSKGFRARLAAAVVKYIPKEQVRARGGDASSSSSTQHSIIITKDTVGPN